MPGYMKPIPGESEYPYGHCFYRIEQKMHIYKPEDLKSWTIRELLLKHYYLTVRLDGYGHLSADESHFANCTTFRNELHSRNVDAVRNVMDNEMWYNWGYRTIGTTWVPLNE